MTLRLQGGTIEFDQNIWNFTLWILRHREGSQNNPHGNLLAMCWQYDILHLALSFESFDYHD